MLDVDPMTPPTLQAAMVRHHRMWWSAFSVNLAAGLWFACSEDLQWMGLLHALTMSFMIASRIWWQRQMAALAIERRRLFALVQAQARKQGAEESGAASER